MKTLKRTVGARAGGLSIEPLLYLCSLLVVGAFLISLRRVHRSFAVAGILLMVTSPLVVWLILAVAGRFYSKRSQPGRSPSAQKMQQTISGTQQEVIAAAEKKLGRSLTDAERQGILSIRSLMVLESCHQAFTSPVSTQGEVLADLEHFAKQAQKG